MIDLYEFVESHYKTYEDEEGCSFAVICPEEDCLESFSTRFYSYDELCGDADHDSYYFTEIAKRDLHSQLCDHYTEYHEGVEYA
jgi:hypothetical protein